MTVTMRMSGGCGNQLFQWATGRAIELQQKHEVQFDISPLDTDPQRCYLLDRLGLRLNVVRGGGRGAVLSDPDLRFRSQVLSLSGDWILSGFWQCEKYFLPIQDLIRDEVFRGMPAVSQESFDFAEKIRAKQNSVFLHIRRTDNTHPAHTAVHGLLDRSDYYVRATDLIASTVAEPHYFVFSDDPQWARENMTDENMTVVDCNPVSGTPKGDGEIIKGTVGKENEDLWLMSLCKHGIVANSTFSFWGAWLNPLEKTVQRIVIAPKQDGWFAKGVTRLDSSDIIPERWIRL